jgi:flagellar biogenesis protein FliO
MITKASTREVGSVLWIVLLICAGVGAGAAAARGSKQAAEQTMRAGGGESLGKADRYVAVRVGDTLVLVAVGSDSTGGFKHEITKSEGGMKPPQFNFLTKAPTDMVTQVITPYTIVGFFPGVPAGVTSVTMNDSAGAHPLTIFVQR